MKTDLLLNAILRICSVFLAGVRLCAMVRAMVRSVHSGAGFEPATFGL
jgi:hypothetical protein